MTQERFGTNCGNCRFFTGREAASIACNAQGGVVIEKGRDLELAKKADLITLPGDDLPGNVRGCANKEVDQIVNDRMCCAYWDNGDAYRQWKDKVEKGDTDTSAHQAATSHHCDAHPSPAQLHAGNYRKGHINVGGLDIAIENPAGTRRRPQFPIIRAHYGYIKRTEGADGDHVDVFVKPGTDEEYCGPVYVINQPTADGVTFDEHKCMIGWGSQQGAVRTYLSAYQAGWKLGTVVRLPWTEFVDWVAHGDTKVPLVPVK